MLWQLTHLSLSLFWQVLPELSELISCLGRVVTYVRLWLRALRG